MTALLAVCVSPEASRTPVALPAETVISATSAPVTMLPPAAATMPASARIMVSAPPLPSTMPKLWLAIDFEIREHRTAGDVGREIEMHAPGGERRSHMRRLEILFQPGAG